MAILGERETRRRLATVAVSIGLTALAGCFVFEAVRGPENRLAFSHRQHVVEEGLDCTDCHQNVEDADDPGMPGPPVCALCHDEDEEMEKPPEERISSLLVDGAFASAGFGFGEEVIFPHLAHATGAYDCADCHTGIEESENVAELPRLSMEDCMSCHERDQVRNDCAACHREIGQDRAPDSHQRNWMRVHGEVVRSDSQQLVNRCDMCHTGEADCRTCHLEVPPQNHTNYWRQRGHGLTAQLDRMSCATCHRTDSCNRCHEQVLPMSHRGMWAGGQNTHCLSCHFPVESQSCATCHKATPGHLNAAPLPPNHNPAMNCRQCHGLTAPMPHVDNGDECILCHR